MAHHGTVQGVPTVSTPNATIDTDQGDSVEIVEESSIGEGLKKGEKVLKVKKEKINVFTKDGGCQSHQERRENNNKFRLDVWGAITLWDHRTLALFCFTRWHTLIRQSVLDPDTGGFTLAYSRFFSDYYSRYPDQQLQGIHHSACISIAIATPLACTCSRSL